MTTEEPTLPEEGDEENGEPGRGRTARDAGEFPGRGRGVPERHRENVPGSQGQRTREEDAEEAEEENA